MTEKRIPIFTFTQRIGNTNFTAVACCRRMLPKSRKNRPPNTRHNPKTTN